MFLGEKNEFWRCVFFTWQRCVVERAGAAVEKSTHLVEFRIKKYCMADGNTFEKMNFFWFSQLKRFRTPVSDSEMASFVQQRLTLKSESLFLTCNLPHLSRLH